MPKKPNMLELVLSNNSANDNPSEIRTDYRNGYKTIISRLRGKQYLASITTEEYKNKSDAFDRSSELESRIAKCVFEPGKEDLNVEVFRAREPWEIRVIENKFPSLTKNSNILHNVGQNGLFASIGGYGYNEIVVDSPCHTDVLEDLNLNRLTMWLDVLISRGNELYSRKISNMYRYTEITVVEEVRA